MNAEETSALSIDQLRQLSEEMDTTYLELIKKYTQNSEAH